MKNVIIGSTHAAHETRHLSRKIAGLRLGKMSQEEIKELLLKVKSERKELIEKYEDCCSYLDVPAEAEFQIPELSKETAKMYTYIDGLVPTDFLFISKLETYFVYGTQPPTDEHLHTGTMLLVACIHSLSWAIAELNAYLSNE